MKSWAVAILMAGLIGAADAARADCVNPAPEFDAGYCQTKLFAEADQSLNQVYGDLLTRLTEAEGKAVKHDEIAWLHQRDALCTIRKADRTYVDFGCATEMTKQRLGKLKGQLAALPAAAAKGTGTHGCAVFGGVSAGACQDFPDWTVGAWQPPAGVASVRVLVVGGGGGGAASIERGIGGAGGASGKVIVATVAVEKSQFRSASASRESAGPAIVIPDPTAGPPPSAI